MAGPIAYRRMPDETVQCPACKKYNDVDARYCDQCGAKLPDTAYMSNIYRLATPKSETTSGRKAALKAGLALPPPSPGAAPGFPITDASHWEKARQAVGRVGDPSRRAQLAKLLRKTAPKFGKQQALKQSWAASNGATMTSVQGYDLAARYHALQLAGPDSTHIGGMESDMDDNPTIDGVECGNSECKALNNSAAKYCSQCGTPMPDSSDTNNADGTTLDKQPADLRTPATGDTATAGFSPGSAGINVRGAPSGNYGSMSNRSGRVITLARRLPVRSANDVVVSRGDHGNAIIRHRSGGGTIGEIWKDGTGWHAQVEGGQELHPYTHQRSAFQDLLATYNRGTTNEFRPASEPLQPPPVQTPLMERFGVPAIRALATPANGASDGARISLADSDGDGDDDNDSGSGPAGLTPRGLTIYKKLVSKGFPPARALAFARNAQKKVAAAA